MENVEGFADTVRTAAGWTDGRPVRISPLTLATLRGPWPGGPGAPGDLPRQVDPRQPSLFTAAFTVAALGPLLSAGAEAVTLYETAGWRGVMAHEQGPAHPAFHAVPGTVYPVWHVLADLADVRGGAPLDVTHDGGRGLGAWAAAGPGGGRLAVANLGREPLRLAVDAGGRRIMWVRTLDLATVERASRAPLEHRADRPVAHSGNVLALGPYACVTVAFAEADRGG
jgi:D-apionolactonase